MDPFLGVRPAKGYAYFLILAPVGSYYAEGMNPVKILVTDKYVRAVQGGVGAVLVDEELGLSPDVELGGHAAGSMHSGPSFFTLLTTVLTR